MMIDSSKSLIVEDSKKQKGQSVFKDNIIRITRRIIKNMKDQNQRFKKAKAHLVDALKYKHPRYESQALDTPLLFKYLYGIHINSLFEWILFIFGYMFMFLVIADNESYTAKIILESIILFTFVIDLCIIIYCKQRDVYENTSKYSTLTKAKLILNLLMIIDLIIFITLPAYNERPIRPFRILRCFIPLLYDSQMRKTVKAFFSAYKDCLVYIIFFSLVIVGYSLLGAKSLTFNPQFKDPTVNQPFDYYKTNYNNLVTMIFTVYVTATYDSYPDNQLVAIQNSQWNYLYFIVFIFLNMFVFSSIPGSLIFLKFKQTRSKILLLDELRQQHSLILAFVTLAENQKDLDINKLIQFLLYLYRYKIRYIEYITDICLFLDDNNNKSIQVNQFMQISKILLQNQAMLPPSFDDIETWIKFRHFVNKKIHLKTIVKNWKFELIVAIIIILSFINVLFLMFAYTPLTQTFDHIFIWIFAVQLILRIIAIGPENLYMDKANYIDTFLVLFGVIFFFIPSQSTFDSMGRIYRIFRLGTLARLLSRKRLFKNFNLQIWSKIINIFSIMTQITPIILKFMPLFFFFFYIFGIIGMELFYNLYTTNGSSAYNQYRQFSDFKTFIHTQYIMVQVLTEAGWSQLAFDHSWRAPQYGVYIMLYFCFMHIIIVYVIATLIKGIFWQVFFTVDGVFRDKYNQQQNQIRNDELINDKALQIDQINLMIENNQFIQPNTILKRQIIQNKLDQKIFQKLKTVFQKQIVSNKNSKSKKSIVSHHILDQWNIDVNSLQISEAAKKQYKKRLQKQINRRPSLYQIQQIDKQDIESQISQIMNKIIISPQIKYNELVVMPKIFVQFLKSKFKHPQELIDQTEFDLHLNPLYNQKSIEVHTYEIHALLGIETSKRQQKAMIIDSLIKMGMITEAKGEELITKKLQEKIFHIDTNGALRKLYLTDVNEDLMKKFQIQYFSNLYGYSFKHINKMTLQPLLKFQSTLMYSLKNILRYPQIDNSQFFQMLTNIEDKLSNQLLQEGSLFKFIYKLDYEGDIWFSIQYKQQQSMKIHFIKTGIWCYYKEMKEKKISYARDIFNWDFSQHYNDDCHQYVKKFYESFEGLAFSLLKEENFFIDNPKTHVYDLYLQHFDVQKIERYKTTKLQISKIMVVILSKQQQRSDIGLKHLDYQLSDIIPRNNKKKKLINFKFDQSESDSFQKLKNIAASQSQKIVDSEGLPFAYMINLMRQIEDILSIYNKNFIYQIQKVLNIEYNEMNYVIGSGSIIKSGKQIQKYDSPKKKEQSVDLNAQTIHI